MNAYHSLDITSRLLDRIPDIVGARLCLAFIVLLTAGAAQAAEIYVDGVACQLSDAITAANTDEALYGCAAGAGADTLILTRDIKLQLGNLPSITSDITIEFGDLAAQENCIGTGDPPDDPKDPPPGGNTPPDTPDDPNDPPDTPNVPPEFPLVDPSNTPTATSTASSTASATATGTASVTPTNTATATGTASVTPTNTATATGTASETTTATATGIGTPSENNSPAIPAHCLHIVASGENLYRIALLYDLSVREMSDYNNLLSDDRLTEGQELIIPYEDCLQFVPYKG